ncbi:MAG TPA: hypothetical protein VHD36_04095 [Pirellulales bacterium]|nr:hypothetical protein [Pirellulales bacterium]
MADDSARQSNDSDSGAPPDGVRRHDDVRFDESQVSPFGVILVLCGIAVVFAAVMVIGRWFLATRDQATNEVAAGSNYSFPAEAKPRPPRLDLLDYETEVHPNVFGAQLARERALHSYGTTNENDYVRIPIEAAMKLVVKSLPEEEDASPPEKAFGLVGGGESNSGTRYAEPPRWMRGDK